MTKRLEVLKMDRLMTIEEIEAQFKSEWILVEDPETDEALEVLSGKVRCHSKDRDEVYQAAAESCSKRIAVLYTGTMPEDMVIIL
jgi:hypothetical protein